MTERPTPDLGPDAAQDREPRTATTAEEAMRQQSADGNTPPDSDTDAALLEDSADEQAYAPEDH